MPANLWRVGHEAPSWSPLGGDQRADLLVIGAGYTGCSAALSAAEQGASTILLDGALIGHGGSGRNVGLVNAGLWLSPREIEKRLGREVGGRLDRILRAAPDQVFSVIERLGIECDVERKGTLQCATTSVGVRMLQERQRQLEELGDPAKFIQASEAQARVGSNQFLGALYDPNAGTIQPLAYCYGLAKAASDRGVLVYENTAVRALERDGLGWRADTDSGSVFAKRVLVATNGYQSRIAGVPSSSFTPVNFFQFATNPIEADLRSSILPGREGCWDTGLVMSSFRLDAEGRLVVGSVGNPEVLGGQAHASWAKRKLKTLFPQVTDVGYHYSWCGRIAMTKDHLPKIVRIGPDALSVFGFSGRGIGPGTVFGARAARALLSGDERVLPLPVIDRHSEYLHNAKAVVFELGTRIVHSLSDRF